MSQYACTARAVKDLLALIDEEIKQIRTFVTADHPLHDLLVGTDDQPGSYRLVVAAQFHFQSANTLREVAKEFQLLDPKRYEKIRKPLERYLRPWAIEEENFLLKSPISIKETQELMEVRMVYQYDNPYIVDLDELRRLLTNLKVQTNKKFKWMLWICKD